MSQQTLVILPEDRQWLEQRIEQLDQQIKALGPEFHEVLNQSSETWHDNAPFDAVREKQDLLVAERGQLKEILAHASLELPDHTPGRVSVGSTLALEKNGKTKTVLVVGDWSPRSGKVIDGILIVSRQTPLAQAVIGRPVGQQTGFGIITTISEYKSS